MPLPPLIDLSGLTLAELNALMEQDGPLAEAIRRVTQAAEDESEDAVCAFNSAI